MLLLAICTMATAQTTGIADSAKHADIVKMLRASGGAELGIQMMDNILPTFVQAFPQVPEQLWEEIKQEFSADALIDMIAPVYDKYYSHEEIQELIAFYESPIGKKLVERTPLVMQESMAVGQKWGYEVAEKIMKKLESKGYKRM